jgi:anthraniloyl-CoA monooxygenase
MQVVIVGGGPAGLYAAVLLRLVDPEGDVVVLERRAPDDGRITGDGVMLSAQSLARLRAADPPTFDRIAQRLERWSDIVVHVHGRSIRARGHDFVGIGRAALTDTLAERADALGAVIRYGVELPDEDLDRALDALGLGGADLVIAADGAHSALRTRYAEHFKPYLDERPSRIACFSTTRRFDASTFMFVDDAAGVFQAHAFPHDERHSTFIVQCDAETWRRAGLDTLGAEESARVCERLFAAWLDRRPLVADVDPDGQTWRRFVDVTNDRWYHGRLVLLGDAAHTWHFSAGLAPRLQMEDALSLVLSLADSGVEEASLAAYTAERKAEALRHRTPSTYTRDWFENVGRYLRLPTEQFAYALITRSLGLSHETLRRRDREFIERVERSFAAGFGARDAGLDGHAPVHIPGSRVPTAETRGSTPPMFTPFRLREMTVCNRVVLAPMDLDSADDGTPNDFHVAHFSARALGGVGLLMTESVAVSSDARLSLGNAGMYDAAHVPAWRRVVDAVHRWSPGKICLQLGHAGPRGAVSRMWEGGQPLQNGAAWEILGPSAVPYREGGPVPRAMTRADMDRVRDDFVRATRMAAEAEFDMLELQCAHGLLLSAFITPLANHREDEYGGSLENRLRFPLEVFAAMRAAWPAERPLSVCISASDWVPGGVDASEGVAIARAFHEAGADIVQVSAGHTPIEARIAYGRMYLTPLSDRVRNEAGVPTIAVGNITDANEVNAIVAAGRADLCALGRPLLTNPHWTLHAAAECGVSAQWWPAQYERGRRQLERELEHRVDMLETGAL